jgi:hypothetical protein
LIDHHGGTASKHCLYLAMNESTIVVFIGLLFNNTCHSRWCCGIRFLGLLSCGWCLGHMTLVRKGNKQLNAFQPRLNDSLLNNLTVSNFLSHSCDNTISSFPSMDQLTRDSPSHLILLLQQSGTFQSPCADRQPQNPQSTPLDTPHA